MTDNQETKIVKTAKQTIAILQMNTFNLVKVKFKQSTYDPVEEEYVFTLSDKSYTYKASKELEIRVGDEVVVDSPSSGYVVVVVVEVSDSSELLTDEIFARSNGYKWVVSTVRDDDYRDRASAEELAKQLLLEQQRKALGKQAIKEIQEMFNGGIEANVFTALGIQNVPADD